MKRGGERATGKKEEGGGDCTQRKNRKSVTAAVVFFSEVTNYLSHLVFLNILFLHIYFYIYLYINLFIFFVCWHASVYFFHLKEMVFTELVKLPD